MLMHLFLTIVAIVAGGIASVTGFGIGSLLTPALAIETGLKVAVAAVSIPHVVGTAVRFWLLRGKVDRRVVVSFGLTSAAGSLTGALLHERATSPLLTIIFGGLLLFVAASELTGLGSRMRFRGAPAWIAGAASGLLGGLVGNQGGIRSGALLGFAMPKDTFVATATAIGLIVDAARMPVYFASQFEAIVARWPLVALATAGVVAGTIAGTGMLKRIPESVFRRVVAVLLAVLGGAMAARGIAEWR
jgi:uncharacterized membrane protein YfcA